MVGKTTQFSEREGKLKMTELGIIYHRSINSFLDFKREEKILLFVTW
jgi:hypothetical protein